MNERSSRGGLDRRGSVRIEPKGTLIFRGAGHEQRARISNLTEAGVYAVTEMTAPARLLSMSVDLELRFDAGDAEWMHAKGRVIRVDPDGVAIAFDHLTPRLLAAFDDLTIESRARDRVTVVVLIDADEQRRSAMAVGFRATGCTVVEAPTPLAAIVQLGESSFEPHVIAIADSQPPRASDEMRAFVEREHPSARLITIGDEVLRPDGFANWLSSANPDADLPARVRAALSTPERDR